MAAGALLLLAGCRDDGQGRAMQRTRKIQDDASSRPSPQAINKCDAPAAPPICRGS